MHVLIVGPTLIVRAKYTKQRDGNWTSKRSTVELRDLAVHHISLESDISIRVRSYRKEQPTDSEWQDPVIIRTPESGRLWDSVVVLKSFLPADLNIFNLRICQRSTVVHEGLRWELSRRRDGCVLRASIPMLDAVAMRPDIVHSNLVTDLITVLNP